MTDSYGAGGATTGAAVTDLAEGDVRIDVYRTGIRCDVLVRVTHLPTGLTAECGDTGSELLNRERALKELRRKVGL